MDIHKRNRNNEDYVKAIAGLYVGYGLIIELLELYFSGYLLQYSQPINLTYLNLVNFVEGLLETPGLGKVRSEYYLPYETLGGMTADDIDWDYGVSNMTYEFYAKIEKEYLLVGAPDIESFGFKELYDNSKRMIEKYKQNKTKGDKNFYENVRKIGTGINGLKPSLKPDDDKTGDKKMVANKNNRERIRVLASEITGRCESQGAAEIGIIIKRTIALAKMTGNKVIEYWAHILQSGIGIVRDEKNEEITLYSNDWEKALRLNETTKGFGGRAFSYYRRAGLGPETMAYIFEEIALLNICEMEEELNDYINRSYQSPDYPVEAAVIDSARTNVMYIESVFERVINTTHDWAASVLSGLEGIPAGQGISRPDIIPKRLRFFVYTNLLYWLWFIFNPVYKKFVTFMCSRKWTWKTISGFVVFLASVGTLIWLIFEFGGKLCHFVSGVFNRFF